MFCEVKSQQFLLPTRAASLNIYLPLVHCRLNGVIQRQDVRGVLFALMEINKQLKQNRTR